MVVETACPECGARVARCDNAVLLDVPAVAWSDDPAGACWTVMQLGATSLASVGGPGSDGKGHTLHEHQPEEE